MSDDSSANQAIDVAHLSALARLAVTADQIANSQAELGSIMNMIDAMQSINTDGVLPLSHPLDAQARLRADQVTETVPIDAFQANAPATAEGYYLVPRVVE